LTVVRQFRSVPLSVVSAVDVTVQVDALAEGIRRLANESRNRERHAGMRSGIRSEH